jgi:hypothetical protein
MSPLWKRIISVMGGLTVVAGLIFGVSEYEAKFARADHVTQLEEKVIVLDTRLQRKILSDRLYDLEKRIWYLEQEFGGPGLPNAPSQALKEEYLSLRLERDNIKRELGKK